jgi:multiple sugar transport system permease protein
MIKVNRFEIGNPRALLNFLLLIFLVILVLIFIYMPVYWLVNSSISTRSELLSIPIHWFPEKPTLQNYISVLLPGSAETEVARTFKITLRNSLVIATSVTIISLFVGSLAAYALVRIRFRFYEFLLIGIIGTRMIPEVSLVIPLYILAARFRILNTPYILIATYLCFSLPFAIWLIAAFFQTIPLELEDAARIDGCSRFRTLFQIIIPVSAPGLVSTALFVFLLAWDEFFFALIFTSTVAAKTVPVAIAEFTGRYVVDVTAMMTGGVLAAIPPVIMALIFQRYIVSGLTAGAVKG